MMHIELVDDIVAREFKGDRCRIHDMSRKLALDPLNVKKMTLFVRITFVMVCFSDARGTGTPDNYRNKKYDPA